MAPLLRVIAPVLVLLFVGRSALSIGQREKLDCSSVIMESYLPAFYKICASVHDPNARIPELSFMERYDMIEVCSCHLLKHPLVWRVMLTHEVESLYQASRKYINAINNSGDTVVKTNPIFNHDQEDHMYFWDRFNSIVRLIDPDSEGDDIYGQLMEQYSNDYYNPESFKLPFKGNTKAMGLRRLISATCNKLLDQFQIFAFYFGRLNELSENPRYAYRLLSYDDNLYKVSVVFKTCKLLDMAKQLV